MVTPGNTNAAYVFLANRQYVGPFLMFINERHQTYLEVLNRVTLTELGILIDLSIGNQNIK